MVEASARLTALQQGIRDMGPILIGVVPFGLVVGVAGAKASMGFALVAPAILIPPGAQTPALPNDRPLPGLIAGLVAWKSKNILLTIAAGMTALWVEQWVLGW